MCPDWDDHRSRKEILAKNRELLIPLSRGCVPNCVRVTNLSVFSFNGTVGPKGQSLKDEKGENIMTHGDTVKTAHLGLSEPGGAPVTRDEACPLGLKWTRGLFKLESERDLS